MSKEIITFPCIVSSVTMLANRDLKGTFRTDKEIDPLEMAIILNMGGRQGFIGFKETTPTEEDFADLPEQTEFKGDKTPAQRLRGSLYVLWKQQGSKGDFELYYKVAIERLIDEIKTKLE